MAKRVITLLILGVAAMVSAFAATTSVPDCQGVTMDQLIGATPLYTGCTVQDKLFTNFSWSAAAVAASSVSLIDDIDPGYPGGSPVVVGLGLSGPFGVLAGGTAIDINLSYTVTVTNPNYLIDDATLFLSGVAFHGGTGSLTGSEDWCAGANVHTGCVGGQMQHADILYSAAVNDPTYHVLFSPGTTFVTVTKDIQVNPDPTVPTDFSRLDQSYSQTLSGPEPVSMILFGSGLTLVGLVGRKLRKS